MLPVCVGGPKTRRSHDSHLFFAFPRHPWSASNPSHQHPNLTRQPRSVTNLFASTPPPGNRQQRQGDQFGGTEFFDGDKANVAGNWGSLPTGQRKVTKPLADRATRPTTDQPSLESARQFASSQPWFPGHKTRQHGGGRKRAVTDDEAVDMLSLLLCPDMGKQGN